MSKLLDSVYNTENDYEVGVDECARGPMFGRLYTAAAILPKDNFDHSKMKDSKKIKSRKIMRELADYIKTNSISWSIDYIEANEIDEINIRQAVLKSMKESIKNALNKLNLETNPKIFLVIDGNDFLCYKGENEVEIPHICIKQGDNKYSFIAAASILAKDSHDTYIEELCEENPLLQERYGIKDNVGYGTKKHMDGIKNYGITQWHRKSYGCCKTSKYNPI
jgi:ribonuclease HII